MREKICPCCNKKIKCGIDNWKFKEHVKKCEEGWGNEKGKSHPKSNYIGKFCVGRRKNESN